MLLCGAGLAASPLPAQIPDESCEADGGYRALDFLLGEWRLVSGGETVGRGKVEKLEGGCLIAETWSFVDGGSGRTYSSFDRAAGVWRRFGVSNRGVIVRSDGTFDGDEFTFEGEYVAAAGRTSNWRERLTREADGRIARIAGTSRRTDRGDRPSTVLFEGHYVPVVPPAVERSAAPVSVEVETADPDSPPTAEEPAKLATAREPAPAPAEPGSEPGAAEREATLARAEAEAAEPEALAPAAGEVTPASARATDAERIERIAMASPMVLRLPLGAVEALPRGYAWITRDTAPYLCEGVTIERLEVGQRRRRGRIELEVELAVRGRQVSRAVDVSVDLRRSGQPSPEAVVASGSASSRVGRSIPEQIQYGSVAVVATLSMTEDVFDSVVAEAVRPDLVITLAVGK